MAATLDDATLRDRLVENFLGTSRAEFATLAYGLSKHCEETGDARYCILGEAVTELVEWRAEHEQSGGVPADALMEVGRQFALHLGDVLSERDPAKAARLAGHLRADICARLLHQSEWSS